MTAHRSFMLITLFMVILLLLQQNFGSVAAARPVKPKPPSTISFSVNRYKMIESDAFRPTTPGHSPGVGHRDPPATS
ncbi:hypothetical protein FH972_027045 [Carpinus fangiana]|uniref:Transmembrane protein n=1 Tax=Carpinus fangiana TaxID=176857 RepID=A0A5N6L638_9ROSI|nr:hypothetical protein FH972_027045 [Carpinus fangiana]